MNYRAQTKLELSRKINLFSSTIISASWQYSVIEKVNFDFLWHHVKEIILQNFAGDVDVGIPSPSVQNTIYLAQRDVLKSIKEVSIYQALTMIAL